MLHLVCRHMGELITETGIGKQSRNSLLQVRIRKLCQKGLLLHIKTVAITVIAARISVRGIYHALWSKAPHALSNISVV